MLPVLSAVEFLLAIHDVLADFTVYPVQYITPIVKFFTYVSLLSKVTEANKPINSILT